MAVSRKDVLHVARLARLRLEREEIERFTVQLNAILAHVAALSAAESETAPASGTASEWEAPLRGDGAPPDPLAHSPASLAPAWEDGFFTVPRLPALDSPADEEGL